MPELPEVRTVVADLKKQILNKTILDVDVFLPKLIKNASKDEFVSYLKNETIIDINALGKYIIIKLTHNKNLISHLRMTGKYFVYHNEPVRMKHDYVQFDLSDHITLFYNDSRQFGAFYLKDEKDLKSTALLNKLGKEPWDLDAEALYYAVRKKTVPIKTFLLDQSYILGIGNIYANEILFDVNLEPETKVNLIPLEKWEEILESTKRIFNKAIELRGSTINSYASVNGVKGGFQNLLKVHLRKNKECLKCKNKIESKMLNQRMTYYCPNCQKEKYEK